MNVPSVADTARINTPAAQSILQSWQKAARDLVAVVLSVAAAQMCMEHSRGEEQSTPAQVQPADNPHSAMEKHLKTLDADDFDDREKAQQALIALAIADIKRTKKPYDGKSKFQPKPGDTLDRTRILQEIFTAIEQYESTLPLRDATVFRAPEEWKKKGATVPLSVALHTVWLRTGQPMLLTSLHDHLLRMPVLVDDLDGKSFFAVLSLLGRKEKNTVHTNVGRYGGVLMHHDTREEWKPERLAFSGAAMAVLKPRIDRSENVSVQFNTESTLGQERWHVSAVHAATADGTNVPVTLSETGGASVFGAELTLDPATAPGQPVTLRITVILTFRDITVEKIGNVLQEHSFERGTYVARHKGIITEDGRHAVHAELVKGADTWDPAAPEHFGVTAIGPDGLPMIPVGIDKPDGGRGRYLFYYDQKPKEVFLHLPSPASISRTAEFTLKNVSR